jgi:hypothetical protein
MPASSGPASVSPESVADPVSGDPVSGAPESTTGGVVMGGRLPSKPAMRVESLKGTQAELVQAFRKSGVVVGAQE